MFARTPGKFTHLPPQTAVRCLQILEKKKKKVELNNRAPLPLVYLSIMHKIHMMPSATTPSGVKVQRTSLNWVLQLELSSPETIKVT